MPMPPRHSNYHFGILLSLCRYFTWEKRNTLEAVANPKGQHAAHEKFANYRFDVNEFIRIVRKAVAQVNEQLKAHTYLGHKRPVHDEM